MKQEQPAPAFWDKHAETIGRSWLRQHQIRQLRETVTAALRTPLYQRRLAKAGITIPEDIASLDDLQKIPFTTKDDLREAYPYGLLSVDLKDVIRLHTSSGTTGTPTVIYHTQSDIDTWTDLIARCISATGAHRGDVFQNMTGYGLFTGGLGFHYGAEKVGMLVIPASTGNTRRQLLLMRDFGTTVVHATPSYLLHVHSQMEANGIKRSDLRLRKAFLGAEPYTEETRKKIEALLTIDVYNSYGLSEMNGPGVAFECVHKNGMHVWEDAFILEMINPETLQPVADGEEGEIVFTTLKRTATPLLRYRTRDLSFVYPEPCACGRTHRRIARIKGRSDDMLIINGVNVFPSQIEEIVMKIPEVGTNYQIHIDKHGSLDRLTVRTEIYSKLFTGDVGVLESLRGKIKELLRAVITINPEIELLEPGGLPPSEGKAKRVLDLRPK
jgi:phenylacetate-CoA ligase